jgi:hypothetical protein
MKIVRSPGIGIIGSAVVAVLATYGLTTAAASGVHQASVADSNGTIHVPSNYRLTYQYLGGWAIAAEAGQGSKEMHSVYASPRAIAAFRKSGTFADGTVLVKEVFATDTQTMTTGTVSHVQALKGWFVMIKDSKGSHPDNALWGNGWGWSWFDAGEPNKTTSTDFKKDCLACHVPAKATDWIYTQGYPALKPQ